MGIFLVVGLDAGIFWPSKETQVHFRGHKILLRPETETLMPSVVLEYEPSMTNEEALFLVRRFLSSLSWIEGSYLREEIITGGGLPINVGKSNTKHVSLHFNVDYLPDPQDSKAQLALALYREAQGVNSIPHQFLGYFKIINILYNNSKKQIDWINNTVNKIEDPDVQSRLSSLKNQPNDVGRYLYESGRCAVAHSFNEPIVDPDNPTDRRRLSDDLPVIKALAEYLIEHELGILSQKTIRRLHLYELDGFRKLLGNTIVECLKQKQKIDIKGISGFPKLSIRLRNHTFFETFENLSANIVGCDEGRLFVNCTSMDGYVSVELALNFAEERLEFDPFNGMQVFDDSSVESMKHNIDKINLLKGLLVNGQLEIWDTEKNSLLARSDPYIPVNIDVTRTLEHLDQIIKQLRSDIDRPRSGQG